MNINLTAFMALVLETLTQRSVLASTITNTKDVAKGGSLGQTIDVYVDVLAGVTSKTYTSAQKNAQEDYDFDNLDLTTVGVALTNQLYVALKVDGWDTLEITLDNLGDYVNFADSLASKLVANIEAAIGTALSAVTNSAKTFEAVTNSEKGAAVIEQLTRDKLALDAKGVSRSNRTVVVGDDIAVCLINNKDVLNIDKSGRPEALAEAIIGRIAGFDVISSPEIATNSYVAYHKSAFVIASREPGKHVTAAYSEVISDPSGSVDLRFNILSLGKLNATGLHVSTFFTVANIDAANRAVKHTFTFTAPVAA